jgi:HEAT repeat protein
VAPDPELAETLVRMAESEDPAERVSTLSQLAVERPVEPGIVQEILQTALSDEDPNVRGQAVYAVGRRGGVEAAAVLQDALQDSALPVRLMAVDGLGTDEESIALLKQALADSDQAVRELAAMKLESLSITHGIQ